VAGRRGLVPDGVSNPADLARMLAQAGYLADTGVATAAYLALALARPLLLEGEAGVGKTSLAHALADVLGAELLRLQCYEGIDASQALYDWDFPRQLLHLRAAEAAGRAGGGTAGKTTVGDAIVGEATAGEATAGQATVGDAMVGDAMVDRLEHEVYSRRFLLARPLLAALETSPSVLLVDEVDRADDEFEAFLLEVLSDYTITVPELGTVRAEVPPVVIVTSNRTREVHDALKRRCLYCWVEHPSFEREVAIVRRRVPEASRRLAEQVAAAAQALRGEDLLKPPGVAESIDWASALVALGAERLDADTATATLGAVLKYREDQELASRLDVGKLVARAIAGA